MQWAPDRCQSRLTPRAYYGLFACPILVGIAAACATGFALLDVDIKPDQKGYEQCRKLHPERFCRLFNGFEVEPLTWTQACPILDSAREGFAYWATNGNSLSCDT